MQKFINNKIFKRIIIFFLLIITAKYFVKYIEIVYLQTVKSDTKKYVVYECTDSFSCGGLADRLKGIMSAYAWSLITDRHLIIYYTKPCALTTSLEPNEINWNLNINLDLKQTDLLWKIDDEKFRLELESFNKFESTSTFISIRNNLDWIEPLSKNPLIKQRLVSLGYDPKQFKTQFIFKKWYKKLFKLNHNLKLKYETFLKNAKPNNDSKLICAQVRIGGKRDHVKSDAPFTNRENTIIFWDYIRTNFIKNETNYKIFLTTDTRNVELEAIKEFGNDKIIINSGENIHLDRTENLNCFKTEKTFLDFHALQNCDMAIISESGFGKLGVWNRDNPNENLVIFSKKQEIVKKQTVDELFIL